MSTPAIPYPTPVVPVRPWPRMWISAGRHRALELLLWLWPLLGLFSFVALSPTAEPSRIVGVAILWTLLGVLIYRLRRLTLVDPFCVLCGRLRRELEWLVSGTDGAVCADCTIATLRVLPPTSGTAFALLHDALLKFPPTTPCAVTAPLLRTLAELAEPATLTQVGMLAAQLSNDEVGAELLRRVPVADRSRDLAFLLAALLGEAGQAAEAIEIHRTVAIADLPALGRALHLINDVGFQVGAGAAGPELDALADQGEKALRMVEEVLATGLQHRRQLAIVLGTLAQVRLAQNRLLEAEALLERARTTWPAPNATHLRTLGDVRLKAGDAAGAQVAWRTAAALVPADSRLGQSLRERLGGP